MRRQNVFGTIPHAVARGLRGWRCATGTYIARAEYEFGDEPAQKHSHQRLQIRYYWISHIAAQYLFLLPLGTPGLARCRPGCELWETPQYAINPSI
jgi:hypothetical protein